MIKLNIKAHHILYREEVNAKNFIQLCDIEEFDRRAVALGSAQHLRARGCAGVKRERERETPIIVCGLRY